MKKILLYISVITLLISACTEDKGTYDYVEQNEVLISGISQEYVVVNGGAFSITPKVEQKILKDESVLEYLWYAYSNNSEGKLDTIATTKELKLDTLDLIPTDYVLVFRVTDTSTGIFYSFKSKLGVKGFPDGLHVLSNSNGNAQVSILRGVEEGVSDFEAYKIQNNGEIAGRNPVAIRGINQFMRGGKPYRFIIACNDMDLGVYTNGNTFEKTINVADAFDKIKAPAGIKGLLGNPFNPFYKVTGIFGTDEVLYTTFQPGGMGFEECAFQYQFSNCSHQFQGVSGFSFVLFNNTTKGFARTDAWGQKVSLLLPAPDAVFDISNIGLDVIYGKLSGGINAGVFVDSSKNEKYLIGLSGIQPLFKTRLSATGVETATHFEFMNKKQVMYYSSENIIYVYDIVAKKVLYTYELPEGKQLDRMQTSVDDSRLYIAFSDGTNAPNAGSVHILNVDLDGEILGVLEAYENKFGQVVDFFENY